MNHKKNILRQLSKTNEPLILYINIIYGTRQKKRSLKLTVILL